MGNCGSNPKTDEGPETVPSPVAEVDQTKTEEPTNNVDSDKSLGTLLNEKVEEAPKTEEVKVDEAKPEEPKSGEVKIQEEEKPKPEEAKTEA